MDHQRWRGDLRNAAVRLPSHDGLQLSKVCLRGGIPLSAHLGVLFDSLRGSSSIIDERADGFRELIGIVASRHQYLQRRLVGSKSLGPTRRGAAEEQRAHFLGVLERKLL